MANIRRTNAAPAQPETITVQEGHTYTMATTNTFEIEDTEAHEILNRKREAKPSIYHTDMETAKANRGRMYGIKPQPDQKVTTILSQLRIAAKAHGVKIKVVNRVDERGYVGFIALPDTPKTETE